jgi:hypothetical protein
MKKLLITFALIFLSTISYSQKSITHLYSFYQNAGISQSDYLLQTVVEIKDSIINFHVGFAFSDYNTTYATSHGSSSLYTGVILFHDRNEIDDFIMRLTDVQKSNADHYYVGEFEYDSKNEIVWIYSNGTKMWIRSSSIQKFIKKLNESKSFLP